MMKPKAQGPHDEGLLEYLEDIIGSNQYVEKIEEEAKKYGLHQSSLSPAHTNSPCFRMISLLRFSLLLQCSRRPDTNPSQPRRTPLNLPPLLEELNEKRSGLVHRLKITEKERDALESAKTEAESYLQKVVALHFYYASWGLMLILACERTTGPQGAAPGCFVDRKPLLWTLCTICQKQQ
eukprot:369383-Pyramimonas_sp.AAC.1